MKNIKKRAIIFIIDACGVGSMPDWAEYDEAAPANTLASTVKHCVESGRGIKIPNLYSLGIANITELSSMPALEKTQASFGKMAELNPAKDTITGHWEMTGVKATNTFPYYPNGFPDDVVTKLKAAWDVEDILLNAPYSGTTALTDFGDKHMETGYPIVYTSADSVLQLAAHVDKIPLKTQYKWCEQAREIMRGEHEVARIIARPFTTNPEQSNPDTKYIRLNDKRHDYSVLPHNKTMLETVLENDGNVIGIGKIQDIFAGQGVPLSIHSKDNLDGLEKITDLLENNYSKHIDSFNDKDKETIFLNLVETDCNFGHRREPEGFAQALEDIDAALPRILSALSENDVLLISADHGCDPCAAGTDHTREYVPILVFNPEIEAKDLGTRETFADIGATILNWFELKDSEIMIQGQSLI